jgi:hypothetical protein
MAMDRNSGESLPACAPRFPVALASLSPRSILESATPECLVIRENPRVRGASTSNEAA